MDEWKKITGHFRESQEYSHTTISPNGNVWMSMHRAPRDVRLFAGFAGNYELPVVVIMCGTEENNFLKIEALIQKVITSSPDSAPFSKIPAAEKVNGGIINYLEVYAVLLRRTAELNYSKKQEPEVTASVEREDPPKSKYLRRPVKYHGNGHSLAPLVSVPVEQEADFAEEKYYATPPPPSGLLDVNETSMVEFIPNEAEDIESAPIVNTKKLELTPDDFEKLMDSLHIRMPTRSDLKFDLRLIVWNPPADEKENDAKKGKKIGPARYEYKVTFGRFFKEYNLDFAYCLVGEGTIAEKKETLLLFDNDRFMGNEAMVELSRYSSRDKKKMSPDCTKAMLGSLLVETAKLKVTQALGYTTQFTWDVVAITMKGSKSENHTMYLTNLQTKSYKGKVEPDEDENPLD